MARGEYGVIGRVVLSPAEPEVRIEDAPVIALPLAAVALRVQGHQLKLSHVVYKIVLHQVREYNCILFTAAVA